MLCTLLVIGGTRLVAGEMREEMHRAAEERRRAELAEQRLAKLEEEGKNLRVQLQEKNSLIEILIRQRGELEAKVEEALRTWGRQASAEQELRNDLQKERVKSLSLQDQMAEMELAQRQREEKLQQKQQQLENIRQLLAEKKSDERVPYLVDVWAHLEMEVSRLQIVSQEARKEASAFRSQVVSLQEELQAAQSRYHLVMTRRNQEEIQRQGIEKRLREQEQQLVQWKGLAEQVEALRNELRRREAENQKLQEKNKVLVQLVQRGEAQSALGEEAKGPGVGTTVKVYDKDENGSLNPEQLAELRRLRHRVAQLEELIEKAPELRFSAPASGAQGSLKEEKK